MRFSVIIPAYNAQNTIKETIDSVKMQKFKDYEIIIVDDCSTDKTMETLNSIEDIKVFKTDKNLRDGGARNLGLDNATGEYIVFLDADDLLKNENTLLDINNVIGNEKPDVVYLGFEKFGSQTGTYIPQKENSTFKARAREWKYENVWDVCWRREFIIDNNIRFIEEKLFQDFVFYYQGILKANSYAVADFVTHLYRVRPEVSVTTSKMNAKKIIDLQSNIIKCLEMVEDVSREKRADFVYAIYRVNEYACRLMLDLEKDA